MKNCLSLFALPARKQGRDPSKAVGPYWSSHRPLVSIPQADGTTPYQHQHLVIPSVLTSSTIRYIHYISSCRYTHAKALSSSLPLLQEEALLLPSTSPLFILYSICGGQDSPPICISLGPTCILRAKVLLVYHFNHYRRFHVL